MCSAVSGIFNSGIIPQLINYGASMKPLTTEPSLVEPEPSVVGFNVVYPSLTRKTPVTANDCPFETRAEAIDFALEYFGVTIEKVKPINKRGTHFE